MYVSQTPYVSQSEARSAQRCHLRWFGQWKLGLQSSGGESPPARIGSMAHAISAATLQADWRTRAADGPLTAAIIEAGKRQWFDVDGDVPEWFDEELGRAAAGSDLYLRSVQHGTPMMVEERLHVPWDRLRLDMHLTQRLVRMGRIGIEGQPDLVHRMDTGGPDTKHFSGSEYFIDDTKFRQKPDLGGSYGRADTTSVDPQGAFYRVLLDGAGVVPRDAPVNFRQINVYAGPWLTVDDFVDELRRCQSSGARGKLTLDNGLPSRDLARMGSMVSPEVWAEAHRVLANLRHDERMALHGQRLATHRKDLAEFEEVRRENPKTRRRAPREPNEPGRLTPAEEHDARAFVDELTRRELVQVQTCSLDLTAAEEVVRDMLAGVLAAEEWVASGLAPARNLDSHPRGDCQRPYGCDLQEPCRASIGSHNAVNVLRDFADQGRLRLRVLPQGVGLDPVPMDTAALAPAC